MVFQKATPVVVVIVTVVMGHIKEVWGKVIFLNLSVILFTARGVPGQVPPDRYTPWAGTPIGQVHPQAGTHTPGQVHPPGQLHPQAATPLGSYTPRQVRPWAGTPPR